jgi:hypothetical protein
MVINSEHSVQINELKKLSYNFYRLLSQGDEPLTYTFRTYDVESQVEVNSYIAKVGKSLEVTIGFNTQWGGRFSKDTGEFHTFTLDEKDIWVEIETTE